MSLDPTKSLTTSAETNSLHVEYAGEFLNDLPGELSDREDISGYLFEEHNFDSKGARRNKLPMLDFDLLDVRVPISYEHATEVVGGMRQMLHSLLKTYWRYSEDEPEAKFQLWGYIAETKASSGGYEAKVTLPDNEVFTRVSGDPEGQTKMMYWCEEVIINHRLAFVC